MSNRSNRGVTYRVKLTIIARYSAITAMANNDCYAFVSVSSRDKQAKRFMIIEDRSSRGGDRTVVTKRRLWCSSEEKQQYSNLCMQIAGNTRVKGETSSPGHDGRTICLTRGRRSELYS